MAGLIKPQTKLGVAAALPWSEDGVGAAWRGRSAGAGAAWGRRESWRHGGSKEAWKWRKGCVRTGCCCVGAAWERRGGSVGATWGWRGSGAKAAPEVTVEGCTYWCILVFVLVSACQWACLCTYWCTYFGNCPGTRLCPCRSTGLCKSFLSLLHLRWTSKWSLSAAAEQGFWTGTDIFFFLLHRYWAWNRCQLLQGIGTGHGIDASCCRAEQVSSYNFGECRLPLSIMMTSGTSPW